MDVFDIDVDEVAQTITDTRDRNGALGSSDDAPSRLEEERKTSDTLYANADAAADAQIAALEAAVEEAKASGCSHAVKGAQLALLLETRLKRA